MISSELKNFLKAMELNRKLIDLNKDNAKNRRQENVLLEAIFKKGMNDF